MCRSEPAGGSLESAMRDIDSAVLNLTERFCRRFQTATGRTSVWLAFQLTNLSIIMYFVWTGLYFWNTSGSTRIVVALFCGALLYLLTQTIFKATVEAYESNTYRRIQRGLRNPRRVRDEPLRVAFLTLSLVLFAPIVVVYANLHRLSAYSSFLSRTSVFLSYSLILLTTIVLYLLACDPLPPCPGRIAEWLRGIVPGRLAGSESANAE
jgi:hypothetical protein